MAEVIPFGEPENESERMAITYLRGHLPSSYKLFTNLEIRQGEEIFEIDLILLTLHCVYVIDVKNWHGRIEIIDPKWYPDNYQSYPSPLKKLRKHAKVLSSMICDSNRVMQHELSKVHIQATVLMSADDVQVIDQSGMEGDHVTYLDKRCLDYFQNSAFIPTQRLRSIKPLLPHVERAILRKSNRKTAPPRYRDWQVEDQLGSNDRYTEYRARNLMLGVNGWTARLRVYQVDPFLEPAEREAEYKLISTAFQAVRQLPPHANILSVQEFFASHDHDCLVLVTEDIPGQVLRQHIKKQDFALEQKFAIMQDVLQALAHAHKHGVIHRNITPDSIFISADGHARLVGFDYARMTHPTSTIADNIVDDLEEYAVYQAIECQRNPSQASNTSDLFSAGLVFYELLLGFPAFEDANQLYKQKAIFLIKPSERNHSLSTTLDKWLQKLCACEAKQRFPHADTALQELISLATLPQMDLANLSANRKTGGEINTALNKPRFNLFDAPSTTSQSQPDPNRPIVLDPHGIYDIPPGYIPITTEVEWLQSFSVSAPCWVRGEFLCNWAGEWLRVWNKTEAIAKRSPQGGIAEIKQKPRPRLEALFHPLPLPSEWTDKQLLILATKLDSYPHNAVAYLLADVTGSNQQIWLAEPSIQNLAAWLAIRVPEDCKPLEQVWQHQKEHNLATYYQIDKVLLLRRWLGIAEPVVKELGQYPLPIPDFLTDEFDSYWEQQIYRTAGKALDNLTPMNQAGMERIAACAHKVLRNQPHWINKVRETKIAPYCSHQQKSELSDRQPPPQPQRLVLEASPQEALAWATESYLPFRRWEVINQSPQRISEQLADSFVEWMLRHYPSLKIDSVNHSYLNYSVASLVQRFCQEGSVLWVVVDGLGWLDHLELLSFLAKNHALAVESAIQPRFSILPTKTEYAKWSLYTQLLPCDSSWVADAGKAFPKMGIGERYTDYRRAELRQDLKEGKHKLYCWDTEQFDELHHTERDWQHLYQVKRPHSLEGIAKEIQSFVEEYPNPDELRVVIASDHGQILGVSEQITHCPPELNPKGRMAIGKTDDPRFVVLERDRYDLPHDISVVRSSASLGSFSYTTNKKIVGSHGGLFPEEVIVGVSVLRKSVQRQKVLISCSGESKPKQPGELEVMIENPNSVPLTDLCLCIPELPALSTGKLLEQIVPAKDQVSLKVTIPDWPELPLTHEGNRLSLSGELTFQFANTEAGVAALEPESAISVNQIFNSGFDIDEFF